MKNLKNYISAGLIGLGSLGIFGNEGYGQTDSLKKPISIDLENTFLIPFQDEKKGKLIYKGKDLPQIGGYGPLNEYVKYKEDIPYINLEGKIDLCNILLYTPTGKETLVFIDTKNKINLSEKISGKAKHKIGRVEEIIECEIRPGRIVQKKILAEDPSLLEYSNLYNSIISMIEREDDIKNRRETIMEGTYIRK